MRIVLSKRHGDFYVGRARGKSGQADDGLLRRLALYRPDYRSHFSFVNFLFAGARRAVQFVSHDRVFHRLDVNDHVRANLLVFGQNDAHSGSVFSSGNAFYFCSHALVFQRRNNRKSFNRLYVGKVGNINASVVVRLSSKLVRYVERQFNHAPRKRAYRYRENFLAVIGADRKRLGLGFSSRFLCHKPCLRKSGAASRLKLDVAALLRTDFLTIRQRPRSGSSRNLYSAKIRLFARSLKLNRCRGAFHAVNVNRAYGNFMVSAAQALCLNQALVKNALRFNQAYFVSVQSYAHGGYIVVVGGQAAHIQVFGLAVISSGLGPVNRHKGLVAVGVNFYVPAFNADVSGRVHRRDYKFSVLVSLCVREFLNPIGVSGDYLKVALLSIIFPRKRL